MLRRMRGRFGMMAPRMTVRAHIPWYWRALATVLLIATAIVLAGWIYDIGRRFAGYDKSIADQELGVLHERVQRLEAETERIRGNGSGNETSLQIERTAQQKLGEQVKRLEVENGRLREDLAAFENLASGEAKNETIGINRLQVESDLSAAGTYSYRMLLSAPVSHPDREFKGRLQLVASFQQDGKTAMVNFPDTALPDTQKFSLSFKYFRRIEGSFALPANAVLKKLEVRVMQGATLVASQQVML